MQIELQQHPKRYSYSENGVYTISAQSEAVGGGKIKPITIKKDTSKVTSLEGLLDISVRGLVIWIEDLNRWFASKDLIKDLEDSIESNPHYTYEQLTPILGAKMGASIPILKLSLSKVKESIKKEKVKGSYAGVKEVKWSYGSNTDIVGLLKQINWTLSTDFPKPKDGYSIFDLNLSGDYSVNALQITPLDENARIPEGVLEKNLKTINDRLVQLRSDFNSIKDVFYFGKSNAKSNTLYNVIASVEDGDDFSVQVLTKDSVMASKVDIPASQLADVQSKAVDSVSKTLTQSSTDLAKKISANEELLKSAQAGDTQAQDELKKQLAQSQQSLNDTNASLIERLKAKGINI
jgi:hypothetical protein